MADEQRTLTFEEMGELGVVQEVNRQLLHPVGLALARSTDGSLLMYKTEDDEGWRFEGFDLYPLKKRFREEQEAHYPKRYAAFGYIVQPVVRPKSQ